MSTTLTTLERLNQRASTGIVIQARVNALVSEGELRAATLVARTAAEASHSEFPQYAAKWDDYVVFSIGRDVVTKMGVAARAGDFVLAESSTEVIDGVELRRFYSVRNQCDTLVDPGYFS